MVFIVGWSYYWVKKEIFLFFYLFLAFDFCRFCVVIRFFHPHHNGQWPQTLKDFYTRSYPLHYYLILILEKEPVFPFSMFSAKQGNYWYYFYNVFGMTRSLTGDWTRDLLNIIRIKHISVFSDFVCSALQKKKWILKFMWSPELWNVYNIENKVGYVI